METYNAFYNSCCECGSNAMLYDEPRGEIVCHNCGLVEQNKIHSLKPEWRAYNAEENSMKSRIGLPPSSLIYGVANSVMRRENRDSNGNTLNIATKAKFARLSQVDERISENNTRKIKSALLELKRIRSHLNLPNDISETALSLYRLALDKSMVKGRSVIGIMSAAIYLACRKKKVPFTIKDIAEVSGISNKQLGRSIRIFLQNINICDIYNDPVNLINRLGEKLGLTIYTREVAVEILQEAKKKQATIGKAPMSLAASALYIASIQTGERRTQQQIANSSHITPVTIRTRVRHLVEVLELSNFKVKRGAGAKAVTIKNPTKWVRKQRNNSK